MADVMNQFSLRLYTSNVKKTFDYYEPFTSSGLGAYLVDGRGNYVEDVSGFTVNSNSFDNANDGSYRIVVSYTFHDKTLTDSYYVNVVGQYDIIIDSSNVKKTYYYESLNEITIAMATNGLQVYKKYASGKPNEYISNYNAEIVNNHNGTETVKIYVDSVLKGTYDINVIHLQLVSIVLNTDNAKKYYNANDTFDDSGLSVTLIQNDGSILDNSKYAKVEKEDSGTIPEGKTAIWWVETEPTIDSSVDTISITVKAKKSDYNIIETTYDIYISGVVSLDVKPIKTNYYVGESFNPTTDLEVKVTYANKTTNTISAVGLTNIDGNYIFRTASKTRIIVSIIGNDGVLLQKEYIVNASIYNGKYKENHTTLKPNTSVASITKDGRTINFGETYGMYGLYPNGDSTKECKGYIVLGNDGTNGQEKSNAHIVLFDDYTNISHDGNIVVKFPHKNEENSNKINGCKFGHIYNNRLFVSGNSEYKNCDWHSGDVNRSQDEYGKSGDYTYFADLDYCYYGTDNTAIVGYDVSRNGDLMVLKESSNQEATIYKRSIKYENVVDSSGNTLKYVEDRYTLEDMNANGGLGGFTKDTIVNHLGDTYFLTKEGIKKLSYRANIYENAKYTYDVSSKINFKIKNENLQASVLFNDNDKLILKTDRGLYIGIDDFRESEDYHELEWYYLDIQDVRCILSFVDNYIIYGNSIGRIFKLDFNKYFYKDRDRIELPSGTILPSTIDDNTIITSINDLTYNNNTLNQTDIITYNDDYEDYFNENDILHILGKNGDNWKPLHAEIGWYCTWSRSILDFELVSSNGSGSPKYIYVKDTSPNKNMYYDGRIVYIDQYIYGMGLTDKFNGKKYRLKLIESGYDDTDGFFEKYGLLDATSNITVDIPNGTHSMRLSFALDENYEARIVDIDKDNHTFKLKGDHNNYLELIIYNNESYTSYRGYITKEKNISAYYITKPFDFGTMMYEKNVFMWTFANDTGLASETLIKYYTSRKQAGYQVGISPLSMNMKDLSFFSFSFENDMLPHTYTRMRTLANISYLALIFENTSGSNIVMNNLTILYSLARTAKGVK